MGNYDEGIAAFKEALKGEKKSMYYENIASAFDGKGVYDSALVYIDSALLVSNSLFDSLVITHFKGIVYSRLGDFDKAEQVFEECLEKTRFGPEFLYMNSLIHQNASSIAAEKGDYPKALRLAEKSIRISDTLQDKNRLAICIKQKANALYAMHDYQNAMKCMLEYDSIHNVVLMLQDKDRLNEIIRQKETRMLEQQYETERKIIKQRQQYIIIIAILVIVFVAVIVFFLIKDKRQKEALLQQKLDLRNREITSKTMGQMQTNEVLTEVIEKLTHLENNPKANGNNLPMIIRELKGMIDDGSKKDFDYYFVQVHPDFYTHLKQDFPDLTINELRLCALVKANLNIKEIANLNNVSIDSVKSSRKRLRKSLGISDPNVDLGEFLSKY
jgi:tetratricopeptide (TPR) repeat protein